MLKDADCHTVLKEKSPPKVYFNPPVQKFKELSLIREPHSRSKVNFGFLEHARKCFGRGGGGVLLRVHAIRLVEIY